MANDIVGHDAWLEARKALLAKEKAFTRQRDALAEERRALPWQRVEKSYVFESDRGAVSLGDLFDGRSQLVVYHFMFGPDWEQGCPSCSFLADHYDPAVVHLNQRDVTLVAASRCALDRINSFKTRMGWSFPWVSSLDKRIQRRLSCELQRRGNRVRLGHLQLRSDRLPQHRSPRSQRLLHER